MQDTPNTSVTTQTVKKKKNRAIVRIGLSIIKWVERVLIKFSLVPDAPFFDTNQFPSIKQLEDNWETIKKELDTVLAHPERLPTFHEISKNQENCDRCPETTKIIESIPNMMTGFFSILAPGKHIPPHRGPYKGLLRCHLGLQVPEPSEDCWIQVGDETSHWEPGKCIVFDDTYVHQVQNNTDGQRVVLFLDIVRPVRFPGSWLNAFIITLIRWSPYIQDARRNQKAWEYRMGDN
jgi:aspartyl/asparaginyl beta-hydroxylase (cupin superfamily)